MSNALFNSRATVATPAAIKAITKAGLKVNDFILRHFEGDWGQGDQEANNAGLDGSDMLISIFDIGTTKVWVLTEQDRSVTTVHLPSER